MAEEYDFFERIDSLGQMTYWDFATGERRYPWADALDFRAFCGRWLDPASVTPAQRWPRVARVLDRHASPLLPWPTEAVRAQTAALCKDRPTMMQLLNYHGILVTPRQRDLLEAWLNSPDRNQP